jgi:4'-phosphopantetheinyl transferase EntD
VGGVATGKATVTHKDVVCRYIGAWATWESNFDFWAKVLAYLALAPQERAAWQALTGPEQRRREWLLGRIAAKEAVVELVRNYCGLALAPADVVIENDARGAPHPRGGWLAALDRPVGLSIAHSAGQALALAALGTHTNPPGVGIDFERASRQTQEFAEIAFTPEEQAFLTAYSSADPTWPLRLWCAKEALGKALGMGLPGPQSVVATALDHTSGLIRLKLAGTLAAQLPAHDGQQFTATTLLKDSDEGGLVVAMVLNHDLSMEFIE